MVKSCECIWYLSGEVNCFAAVYPHKPIIFERPRNTTAEAGKKVVFECRVLSDLQPYIQWVKHYTVNESYYNDNGDPYVNVVYVRLLFLSFSSCTS